MFDRIAGRYDAMNSVMTAGLHHRWRAARRRPGRARPRRYGSRRLLRDRRPRPRAWPPGRAARQRDRLRLLRADARPGPREGRRRRRRRRPIRVGRRTRAALRRRPLRRRHGRLRRAQPRRPRPRPARDGAGAEAGRARGDPRDHAADRPPLSTFYSLWFDRIVPLLGKRRRRDATRTPTCPSRCGASRPPRELAAKMDAAGFERIRYTVLAGGIIAIHSGARA